jgi:hypothetical protein
MKMHAQKFTKLKGDAHFKKRTISIDISWYTKPTYQNSFYHKCSDNSVRMNQTAQKNPVRGKNQLLRAQG